ncbi:MAG: protein translocase subunit SecD [Verrucomicrobia bacterium]|nr:protein translocase subunit SecD [Verrucomicrobiota bacterium]
MKRNLFWRLALVLGVLIWSLAEIYPPTPRNLLEVFQEQAVRHDTNFIAIAQRAVQLEKARPADLFQDLLEAIGTNDITQYFPQYKVAEERDPNRAILNHLQRDSAGRIKLGLDLQGGTSFLIEMDTNRLERTQGGDARQAALAQAIEVLRRRVDKFGVSEPIIQPVGDNRIQIQIPGLSEADKESAKTQITKTAHLEFRMVHPDSDNLIKEGVPVPGYEILREVRKSRDGREQVFPYLVKIAPERGLTGKYIKSAQAVHDPMTGELQIQFRFDSEGAGLFADVTRENVGHQLAIVLDGQLYSAPRIDEPITLGSGVIRGDFDLKEATELANVLNNPLEAPVHIVEERGVDPTLGTYSIHSGVKAALIGTVAVSLFMLVYYLLAGLIANIALVTNIFLLVGVMCSIETTFTLPGIAGVVLTIGMAVDANVLIYERIREELAAGKSMRGAIAAGYARAFGTIFDSHVTTLISAVILILMGTGPVKGFGVALFIGVSASLFTALVVTRLIFDWLLARGWLKGLPMLHLIRGTRIDFMRYAKIWFAISWTLIVIGVGWGLHRGKGMFGVDFAGGDDQVLNFAQKVEVDRIIPALNQAGVRDPFVQYQKDVLTGADKDLRITSAFNTGDTVLQTLQKDFPQAGFTRVGGKIDRVGATVGKEIQRTAVVASLLALFGILVYVAFRYEFSFAVGAVIAVVHDVLMTIGWFCLSGREFNAPIVAAILTIIGFSINDTIVIFDRIREDLKLGIRGTFTEVMNQALNQTLSRTLITSGTVFLSTLSLYVFGGGAINDFAFTFLVGIITGTYSSIYIASALVLWWHKGERPRSAAQVVMEAVH